MVLVLVLVVVVVVIVYTSRRTATIATSAATLASEVMMNGDFKYFGMVCIFSN